MRESFGSLINSPKPVVVDFSAEWCGPCSMMAPVLKQVKEKYGDRIRIVKIDVDRNPEISSRYGIRSVPSLFLFQNGEKRWSGSGLMSAEQLSSIIAGNTVV